MTILEKIFAARKIAVDAAKASSNEKELFALAKLTRKGRASHLFSSALQNDSRINIIAEFKRRSPSKGIINARLDPAETAKLYANGGAAAMSVLTEEENFGGSIEDLKAARTAIDLPILRKDFIFDRFQIIEAANAGADAILLIAAMLDDNQLIELKEFTEGEFGMDVLLEVHDKQEMERALRSKAKLIGVNNRNLSTFEVSLDVSRQLIENREPDVIYVAESGISDRAEIDELHGRGFNGFLIGETLMRSADPLAELKRLTK